MTGIAVVAALLAPTAPAPETPVSPGAVDRYQAESFAQIVVTLAIQVKERCNYEATEQELVAAAIRGLYDEVGKDVPEAVTAELRKAEGPTALVDLLSTARIRLGNDPKLAGCRSLFAAINGFRFATDPLSMLVSPRLNAYASVDQDFGVGIELEGVTGSRWTLYLAESAIASRRYPAIGCFGPEIRPLDVPSPATLPWRIKRVVPGSPAQQAGIKPGELIEQIDGQVIAPDTANVLFYTFAWPQRAAGRPSWTFLLRREDGTRREVTLKGGVYTPESVFGVIRTPENKWDAMLDRKARIGYIRIGPIETGLDEVVGEMVADLVQKRCQALILDLRWCPGGYIDPGIRMAGLFLPEGAVLAKMTYRKLQSGNSGDMVAPTGSGRFTDLPLVVLVGQETTGGGELIAAALRDNNRCKILGQRTAGRAMIQNAIPAGFAGLQFKLTTGSSLRPNGKARQRLPDSGPTDDWGIRPDEGLNVPVTLDKSRELRREADLHALRPVTSSEALPFDDPDQDPYRLAALAYLRKKLKIDN